MAWLYLICAIATEVIGTVSLRYVDGLERPAPVVLAIAGYAVSFVFLTLTLRQLSLAVTYAVWAGAGTAAIAVIGMLALREPVSAVKLVSIALIISGVIGLNAAGGH
jgi:small multidrug resistance pump